MARLPLQREGTATLPRPGRRAKCGRTCRRQEALDPLALDLARQFADAVFDAFDMGVERLRPAIGLERTLLVAEIFQDRSELCQRDEMLRLQRQDLAQRGNGVLEIGRAHV